MKAEIAASYRFIKTANFILSKIRVVLFSGMNEAFIYKTSLIGLFEFSDITMTPFFSMNSEVYFYLFPGFCSNSDKLYIFGKEKSIMGKVEQPKTYMRSSINRTYRFLGALSAIKPRCKVN